jgi:hypothetical protein
MSMKLRKVAYDCAGCGATFQGSDLIGGYGALGLRSEGLGTLAYEDGLDDSAFADVNEVIDSLPFAKSLPDWRRGDLGRSLFERTCDVDVDGSRFGIGVPPRCDVCGSNQVVDFRPSEPPAFVEVDVPHVTHTEWSSLTSDEKRVRLTVAARDFLSSEGSDFHG